MIVKGTAEWNQPRYLRNGLTLKWNSRTVVALGERLCFRSCGNKSLWIPSRLTKIGFDQRRPAKYLDYRHQEIKNKNYKKGDKYTYPSRCKEFSDWKTKVTTSFPRTWPLSPFSHGPLEMLSPTDNRKQSREHKAHITKRGSVWFSVIWWVMDFFIFCLYPGSFFISYHEMI